MYVNGKVISHAFLSVKLRIDFQTDIFDIGYSSDRS